MPGDRHNVVRRSTYKGAKKLKYDPNRGIWSQVGRPDVTRRPTYTSIETEWKYDSGRNIWYRIERETQLPIPLAVSLHKDPTTVTVRERGSAGRPPVPAAPRKLSRGARGREIDLDELPDWARALVTSGTMTTKEAYDFWLEGDWMEAKAQHKLATGEIRTVSWTKSQKVAISRKMSERGAPVLQQARIWAGALTGASPDSVLIQLTQSPDEVIAGLAERRGLGGLSKQDAVDLYKDVSKVLRSVSLIGTRLDKKAEWYVRARYAEQLLHASRNLIISVLAQNPVPPILYYEVNVASGSNVLTRLAETIRVGPTKIVSEVLRAWTSSISESTYDYGAGEKHHVQKGGVRIPMLKLSPYAEGLLSIEQPSVTYLDYQGRVRTQVFDPKPQNLFARIRDNIFFPMMDEARTWRGGAMTPTMYNTWITGKPVAEPVTQGPPVVLPDLERRREAFRISMRKWSGG